jgi:hypothetical protein
LTIRPDEPSLAESLLDQAANLLFGAPDDATTTASPATRPSDTTPSPSK